MTWAVRIGDCRKVLAEMEPDSVAAVVTDPPYHLTSIVKRFGSPTAAPAKSNGATGVYQRASSGFMGKTWDGGDVAADPETWAAVYRVMRPGAHLLAFGGTRTWHRMACAIEDAGFEIRDTVMWLYGSGFPKSHNLDGDWEGWGTALKPAVEPIVLARKPLSECTVAANVLRWGTGALNIEAARVGTDGGCYGATAGPTLGIFGNGLNGARSAPQDGLGRWPANVAHDGSDEVLAAFARFGESVATAGGIGGTNPGMWAGKRQIARGGHTDTGTAARFFFCGKAQAWERPVADNGERHATVKPVALMEWLVSLITPPGGLVLDPFAGTGSTLAACDRLGLDSIGIDMQPEAEQWCRKRIEHYRSRRTLGEAVTPSVDARQGDLWGQVRELEGSR